VPCISILHDLCHVIVAHAAGLVYQNVTFTEVLVTEATQG